MLVPAMHVKLEDVVEMINEIPVLTFVQKRFYKVMLEQRLEKVLMSVYQKVIE